MMGEMARRQAPDRVVEAGAMDEQTVLAIANRRGGKASPSIDSADGVSVRCEPLRSGNRPP